MANFARMPLAFEPNRGQAVGEADFIARGGGFETFLDKSGATLALAKPQLQAVVPGHHQSPAQPQHPQVAAIRMSLEGASPNARAEAENRLPGVVNYYQGNDPAKWHRGVPTYRRVRYAEVYRGIDLSYYGDRGNFEFDFDLKPRADASQIALAFEGVESAQLTSDGAARLQTSKGNLTLKRPLAYQMVEGVRRTVDADYKIAREAKSSRITIALGEYDHSRPLTIDPVLLFATFFGGTTTEIDGAAIDFAGNVYVTGYAFDCSTCTEFPITSGSNFNGVIDAFISEISSDGSHLVYSTAIGGSNNFNQGKAVAVDGGGNAYLTGVTFATNFPETTGPSSAPGNGDGFVAKLNSSGAVTWATYLGGGEFDEPFSIALEQGCESNCDAYIAGQTQSANFPNETTLTGQNEAFVAEMQPDGSGVLQTTIIAGSNSVAGTGLGVTFATGIAVDSAGIAFVAGGTDTTNFPTTEGPGLAGATDAWVAKLAANGGVSYARLLGGSDFDQAEGIAIPPGCTEPCPAYVEGVTFSADFPTHGGLETSLTSAAAEFVAELSGDGSSTVYSTLIGTSDAPLFGAVNGIAVDSAGDAYIIGSTTSSLFAVDGQVKSFPGFNGALWQFAENATSPSATPSPAPDQLTWPASNGSPLTIPNGSGTILVGTTTGLFVSTDGTTFTRATATGLPSGPVPALQYETNLAPNVIFAGTSSGLYTSTDFGSTFSATGFTKPVEFVVDLAGNSLSTTDVLVGTIGNGAWSSTNGGASFTQVASLPASATVFSLASNAKNPPFQVFAGTSRGVFTAPNFSSSNFPGTWSATNLAMAAVGAVNSDRNSIPPVMYAGSYFQGLFESTDGFNTFVRADIPQFGYSALELDRDNSSTPATVFAGVNALNQAYVYENASGYGGAFNPTNFANEPGSVKGLKNPYVGELLQFHPVIAELSPSGSAVTFSSYLGGTSYDSPSGIAVNPAGTAIYIAGTTYSSDFPTKGTAISAYHNFESGFVAKLGPAPSAGATATSTSTGTPTATSTSTGNATPTATTTATATSSGAASPTPTATATPDGAKLSAPTRIVLRPAGIGVSPGTSAKISIRNIGKTGNLIGNISLSQTGNAFALSAPGPIDIAPHGMLSETITFMPSGTSNSATLSIVSNGGSSNIAVSGIGEPGKLSVPRTLTITATATGAAGAQTITPGTANLVLRNVGEGVLTGMSMSAQPNPPFSGGGGSGGRGIQPHASSTVAITFSPSTTSAATGSIQLVATPPNTGSTTVTLKGVVKVQK